MRSTFSLFLLLAIFLSSCLDSDKSIDPNVPNEIDESVTVFNQTITLDKKTFRLQYYYENDTTKRYLQNEGLTTFRNHNGDASVFNFTHLEWDEDDIPMYYFYKTPAELEAAHPLLQTDYEPIETASGRTKFTNFWVVGYDNAGGGGALRFCSESNGRTFNDISGGSGGDCDNICFASCKNNDISYLYFHNPTSSTRKARFHDGKNLTSHYLQAQLDGGENRTVYDLKFLPNPLYTDWWDVGTSNWRNKISSVWIF